MASESDKPPIAPPRPLTGGIFGQQAPAPTLQSSLASRFRREQPVTAPVTPNPGSGLMPEPSGDGPRQVRQAKLRLVQIEPWSVMKASFLLSVAVGVVTVVAVAIIWGVLGAAGLWTSINSIVQDSVGDAKGAPFQIQDYLGTSRVMGFTMIVSVADVVLITAIATLGAFMYNLAATLVGGVEVTFAEDK
jgi:hypothetical protein